MARLDGQLCSKENEATSAMHTLEQKNAALITDLRFLRSENEKLQAKLSDTHQQVLEVDGALAQGNKN
jgi:regulator of replication initiation timing